MGAGPPRRRERMAAMDLGPTFGGFSHNRSSPQSTDYSGTLLWRGCQKQSHGTCWRARACGRTPAAPRARCHQLGLTTASRGPSQQCQPHCTPTQATPTAPEPRCSFPGAHGGMQGGVARVCPRGSSKALLFARGPAALQLLSLVVRPTPDPQVPDTGPEPCLQLCALGGCVWHPLLGCRPGHPVVRLAGTALPSLRVHAQCQQQPSPLPPLIFSGPASPVPTGQALCTTCQNKL